jgi:hypothetical protein
MSDKLKLTGADEVHNLKRDAVVDAAVTLLQTKGPSWGNAVKALRAAVTDYQAFTNDPGPNNCAHGNCPSPYVCTRHAHCFASEAYA